MCIYCVFAPVLPRDVVKYLHAGFLDQSVLFDVASYSHASGAFEQAGLSQDTRRGKLEANLKAAASGSCRLGGNGSRKSAPGSCG